MVERHQKLLLFMVFSLVCILVSCGNNGGRIMVTANNEKIRLDEGEKEIPLDKIGTPGFRKYERYFNSFPDHQIPLNKAVFSRSCIFYYGIPVDGDVVNLYQVFLDKFGPEKIINNLEKDSSEAKLMVNDSLGFLLVEILKTPRKNLLLGAVISKDSQLINRYYLESNLRKRISDEN